MLQQGVLSFALLGADWVLWILVALSVGCFAMAIERAIFLATQGTPRDALAGAVHAFLTDRDRGAFSAKIARLQGFEARILTAGLEASPAGVEAAREAMTGAATAERLRMERGLAYLATVGSNAPFIGLFGTVLGIIKSFHDLAVNTAEASEAVMAGISEALVATAVGLVVAIPAVVLYNVFTRLVKGRLAVAESLANRVLSRLYPIDGAARG